MTFRVSYSILGGVTQVSAQPNGDAKAVQARCLIASPNHSPVSSSMYLQNILYHLMYNASSSPEDVLRKATFGHFT
jgi:hypothetical protein